jgi:pimeloyl-ACP methyl ester carboxylesterase
MPLAAGIYYYFSQDGFFEAPPIVLLHGAGGMHLFWPPQIRRMQGCRVFTLDLPGHGKSDRGGGLQTIDSYADQVLRWMEAVQLHRAVFVGHSMGGAVALTLGIQHPERVLGLGLVSTGVRFYIPPDLLANAASPTTFHKAIDSLVSCSFGSSASERLVELAANRMREVRSSVLHGDLLACAQFDRTEQLSEIQSPVLILCGSEDQLTPVRNSQYMAGVIPGAALEIIPGAGHMVLLESPDAVGQSLANFLKQIPYHAGEENWNVSGD